MAPILLGAAIALMQAGSALAQTCPQDICACVGEAGHFDVVGSQVGVKAGKVSSYGYSYPIPTSVDNSVCATTGKVSGILDGETLISGDLICTSGPETTALKLRGYRYYGYPEPGVSVEGDIATGGGAIKGIEYGLVAGTTDTTGAHPGVTLCQQAMIDMQSASSSLATLTPTQNLGALTVEAGDTYDLNAGPGVNVIIATSIQLKSKMYSGYPTGATLSINLDVATDSVILNVADKLSIGKGSTVVVGGGDPSAVLINVHGVKPKVKVGKGASVDPAILAPAAKLIAPAYAIVGNLFGTKVKVQGAEVLDSLLCP